MSNTFTQSWLGLTIIFSAIGLSFGWIYNQPLKAESQSIGLTNSSLNSCGSTVIWSGNFDNSNWEQNWNIKAQGGFGETNRAIAPNPGNPSQNILRVQYPAGSVSPSYARNNNKPIGGTQFLTALAIPQEKACLSYSIRFRDGFQFVKGGKLPGFYGGTEISGGEIPDGTNGFSTRYMWRTNGAGELYSYLPTSDEFGTSLGRGNWTFNPGQWYRLSQEIKLNTPGQANGSAKVWVNDNLVLDQSGLIFRTTTNLKIDGIFFSTFFGGNDESWATPEDTYVDFANFSIRTEAHQLTNPWYRPPARENRRSR